MNITETIKRRKSCRTFKELLLSPEDKKALEDFIIGDKDLIGEGPGTLQIIEKKGSGRKLELNYGTIEGHNTYLLGTTKSSADTRVHYGYLMEKAVLKATELGISTCWIGYFDHTFFNEIAVSKGFEIPGIVILGYAKDKQSTLDKLVRFSIKASERLGWGKLFFSFPAGNPLIPDNVKEYSDSLEMLRLAPSAGNTQPWRIYFDDAAGEFHFFKFPVSKRYEERGLHDIDMGIALAHFEVTSLYHNLSGIWIRHPKENFTLNNNLQYIITWKCI